MANSMRVKRTVLLHRDGGIKRLVDNGRCVTLQWQIPCKYCSTLLESVREMSIDHVIPRSKGGSNHIDNLVICCGPCNTKKADKFLVDFVGKVE